MHTNRLFSIIAVLALCFTSTGFQAQAQQPLSGSNPAEDRTSSDGKTQLTNLLSQARPGKRSGFILMRSGSYENTSSTAFSFIPLAAGPSLPVMGGGTVGRLTKWTGFTSSNSSIGDTSIYEDKFGKVGIGTDAPASKLTVAGVIESTGGFKFPDGTMQTSAGVIHDATLKGGGTTLSPLGVAVPLKLMSSVLDAGVIQVTNTNLEGIGVEVEGGRLGMLSKGATKPSGNAGSGIFAVGGSSFTGISGSGITTLGGDNGNGEGGLGLHGEGGIGGGFGGFVGSGTGGIGVRALGGAGNGTGKVGGIGIVAFGGDGFNGATNGLAGQFNGNVQVTGTLSKGGGAFKIDHPLDPENKYLSHSFVESPDMMNIYNGNISTDADGIAIVTLPDYFDVLNKDFRYQLTVIGTFAQAIVADKIRDNHFLIMTNAPNVEVSWQVTGIRHDAFANKHRIQVEEEKPKAERGYYLHPEAFGQPDEKSVNWARSAESMMRLRQRPIEAEKLRVGNPNQR